MVKKSWINEKHNGYFKTKTDLPWWSTYESRLKAGDISVADQKHLDELPDDTASEVEAGVSGEGNE